jgi:hypothetical protein
LSGQVGSGGGSVVVLVRLEILRARELADQPSRLVDHEGEMGGADPILAALVGEGEEGDFIAGLLADQAGGFGFRHGISLFIPRMARSAANEREFIRKKIYRR